MGFEKLNTPPEMLEDKREIKVIQKEENNTPTDEVHTEHNDSIVEIGSAPEVRTEGESTVEDPNRKTKEKLEE